MNNRGKFFSLLFSFAACGALIGAPPLAHAQITGTVTVGVPSSVTVTVPLELTAQMLATADPGMVIYSTSDPTQIFILNSLGFGGDGVATAGELLTVYPNSK